MPYRKSTILLMGASFLSVIALVTSLGIGAIREVDHLADLSEQLYQHPFAVSNALLEANTEILEVRLHLLTIIDVPGDEEIQIAVSQMDSLEASVYKHLEVVRESFLGDPQQIETLFKTFSDWRPIRAEIIDLVRAGKHELVLPFVMERGKGGKHFALLTLQMDGLIEFARTKADEFSAESQVVRIRSHNFLLLMVGAVILMIMMIYFITTKKVNVLHRQLSDSEARFRTMFEAINIGTIVIGTDGSIQIINSTAEDIFGYKSREVVGQDVSMLMPEPARSQHHDNIRNYIETGEAKIIGLGRQVVGLRKNGEEFPMQLKIGELQINGETNFLGSVSDLTELQSLESQLRQAQKLEAVGQLTGGVAHDFNNLLAVIQGSLSLLAEDICSEADTPIDDLMELLQAALAASERGADLTQRLLAFSRKQTLQPRVLDLNWVISDMEAILRRTLGETIALKVILKEGGWKALIDPSQMENAILNLAVNARDAMASGGRLTMETADVHLDDAYLATHQGASAGDFIMLSVSDTGTGMTPDVMANVFDPFFTTKGVGKGSGLGLSMIHGFIKQSGGNIEIYSEPGQGTSVKLYLPRSLEEEGPVEVPEVISPASGQETILIVEDDEDLRTIVGTMLRHLRYHVIEAPDGNSALEDIKNEKSIDLLLTDVVLPGGMTGPEIAKAVHKIEPGIKVLFMSGYTRNAIVHHGRIDENAHLITKPFSLKDLAKEIRKSLASAA